MPPETDRLARAEVRLEQHQEQILKLEDNMKRMIEIQTTMARTSAEMAAHQRELTQLQGVIAGIERRQEEQTGKLFDRVRQVEAASNGSGLFADWTGKILIPVISALIASGGLVVAYTKLVLPN